MDKTSLKKIAANLLEDFAGDIITLTGCVRHWGEVELPECMSEVDLVDCKNQESL